MKKSETKSILACAVLASVLAGGVFVSEAAAQVNVVVGPKDFAASGLIGKDITFGQKRGYSNNTYDTSAPEKISVFNEQPTWQIIAVGNDVATLLAKECWGINRYSDNDMFQIWGTDEASVAEYYCREVLNCLNNKGDDFFSLADLSVLASQTSVEMWNKRVKYEGESGGENKYTGIFALPVKQILEKLSPDQIKRSDAYWLNDSRYVSEYDSSGIPKYYLYYKAGLVGTDGNISEEYGQYVNKIYPVLQVQSPMFAYYGNKQQAAQTFKKQMADNSQPLHLAVKNTQTEKDVQITALDIFADKINFTADGLATGTGQGLAGILADNDGNYVSYARFAETTENSKVDNVTITDGNNKFLDNSQFAAGNYTVYLFNEKLSADPNSFDYVSNFDKFTQVSLNDSGVITKATLFGNRNFTTLNVPENVTFDFKAFNFAGGTQHGSYMEIESDAVKVTDSLAWENVLNATGSITLKGSFSVANDTLTLVRPTNIPDGTISNYTIGWNDIIYNGVEGQNAVLHVNGNMHGLVVNGGTFKAEKDISLSDYLQINNGSTVNVEGNLTVANVSLSNDAKLQLGSDKALSVGNNLTMNGGSSIVADSLTVGNNLQVNGNVTFNDINTLTVKKSLNTKDGAASQVTVKNLVFGDQSGSVGLFSLDLGQDKVEVNGKVTGNIRLVPDNISGLTVGSTFSVFTGSGSMSGLNIQGIRIYDTNSKPCFLMQDKNSRGEMKVVAPKHNAVALFKDVNVANSKIYFGNYWQDNNTTKQPILWDVVRKDANKLTLFSEKVLAKGTYSPGVVLSDDQLRSIGNVEIAKMLVETNKEFTIRTFAAQFDYNDSKGVWMQDAFSAGEAAIFGYKLVVPTDNDIKDGGSFGLTAEQRKASASNFANSATYGIGSVWTNDSNFYLNQVNADGNTVQLPSANAGIRPAMNFDVNSVLYVTNAQNGKGSTAVGELHRLEDVTDSSILELTFDDVRVASKAGKARFTGDVTVSQLELDGGKVALSYSGAKYVDGNSYVSYFVGEGDVPLDYFGYGKGARVSQGGSGTFSVDLQNFATNQDTNGYALTIFNEYGNGTSLVGAMREIPGTFRVNDSGNVDYIINGNVTWQNITVGEHNQLIVQNGTLNVTGPLDVKGAVQADKINFVNGSTIVVDGTKVVDNPLIKANQVEVDEGAKLFVKNGKTGVAYEIFGNLGFPEGGDPDVLKDIVIFDYGAVIDAAQSNCANGKLTVCLKADPQLAGYSDISNIVTGFLSIPEELAWWEETTYALVNMPNGLELVNNAVNTLGNLNSLANVQSGLWTMSSLVTDSIQENVGLRGKDSGLRIEEQGARENVWASFIHSKEKIEGRRTGHLEQNSTLQYNGTVVGADLWGGKHGFGGVALSYADGNVHSNQSSSVVKNEADYYGISVYNRLDVGKFRFQYSGGLTYGKNDVTLSTIELQDVIAKPKARAYNVGFRVDEPIAISKATMVTPFLGARYTFIRTKDYQNDFGMEYTADNQHLVNIPVGLKIEGSYETKEGWTLGGSLTGGYNWNLGNRNSTQTVSYYGYTDSIGFDIADRGEYFVKAGITAKRKNAVFELNYRYSRGNTSRDNRWNINVNFVL